jgi:hypothetical protein
VLAPLALDALREHLPRTLELLALPSSLSPFRGSPSLDLVVAHLSLLGGTPPHTHSHSLHFSRELRFDLSLCVVSCRVVSCRVVSCRVVSCRGGGLWFFVMGARETGYQARPLPGVSVQVHSNAQRRGWVVGLRHAKDEQLVVIATDGHSESAVRAFPPPHPHPTPTCFVWGPRPNAAPALRLLQLNPAEVVVQPDEAEVALVTEVVRAVGPELLQFLPLLAPVKKKPAAATAEEEKKESLSNALVLGHVRALFVKALSRHLAADATLCHTLLADHPDAVRALLALAVADSSSCGNRQPRAERERALAGLYLRTTDALHGARLPQQDAVARELAEWLGKPEAKCAAALGEAANDRLRAFAALTSPESEAESAEQARAQKKLRGDDGPFTVSTADIPTEEFGTLTLGSPQPVGFDRRQRATTRTHDTHQHTSTHTHTFIVGVAWHVVAGGILSDFMWTARSYAELDSPNATSGFSDSGSNQPAWFQLLSTTASRTSISPSFSPSLPYFDRRGTSNLSERVRRRGAVKTLCVSSWL